MESRDSDGVPFAGLESLWPGTLWEVEDSWSVPKSGHVTITKIENLHIEMEILHIEVEISPIQKMLSFSIYDEN